MKVRKKRTLSTLLTLMIVMSLMLPAALADAAPIAPKATAVDGRILTATKAGDTSDWIEIARNGDYVLILRREVLPCGQVVFTSRPKENKYDPSNARDLVNKWFNNQLSASARLRDFTVKNNATANLGGYEDLNSGHSQPTASSAKTGNDVAFLLSFSEAALYCSQYYAQKPKATAASSLIARANNNKLMYISPGGPKHNTWYLRSPAAGTEGTAALICSVGGHDKATDNGTVYRCSVQSSYPCIRPALWVKASIFEAEQANVIVKHLDAGTLTEIAATQNFTINAGAYGPYNSLTIANYGPGTLAAGSAPASGTITAGQTINITYLYSNNSASITLRHISAETLADLVAPVTFTVSAGYYGPYNAITMANYQPGTLAAGSAPVSGYITAGQSLTITYEYRQSMGVVIVWHKNATTNENVKPFEFHILSVGSYGPYLPADIPGFTSSLAPYSAPVSGILDASQVVEITYLYTPLSWSTIVVEYREESTGRLLQASSVYTVSPGTYGPFSAPIFVGYYLPTWDSTSAPITGTIEGGQTLTIVYRYRIWIEI